MMRVHRSSRLRSAGGVAALAAFAAGGFALGSAQPTGAGQALQFAAAPAAAAPAPPVQLAALERAAPEIVVTGRRRARTEPSAAAQLRVEPMSFASVEAPAAIPTTLASMTMVLRHLPRTALAPKAAAYPAVAALAMTEAPPAPVRVRVERHLLQVVGDGAEARLFVVGETLSAEQAAELHKAVRQAVVEGRKVRFRVERGQARSEAPGGGGGEGVFDINVQTLVKGD
jgi:hypothetical protein